MDTEQFIGVTKNHKVQLVTVCVASAALGAVGAHFSLRSKLEAKYAAIADREIAEAKAFNEKMLKRGEYSDVVKLAEEKVPENKYKDLIEAYKTENTKYDDVFEEAQGQEQEEVVVESKEDKIVNVFGSHDTDDFNYDEEVPNRDPDHPYVITYDEFNEEEQDFEKISLTFYEGDGVLADDKDSPVPDEDSIVGDENLSKFGYGSKDHNIVYVRNEHLESDFEILRTAEDFASAVLGFQHSEYTPRGRKFREWDE